MRIPSIPAPTLRLSLVSVTPLPLRGASGVTRSRAGLLLLDDDRGIYRLHGTTATLWAGADVHPAFADLEGIASDETGSIVWVLAEERGTLVELDAGRAGPVVRRVAQLRRPGTRRNKGFEGLAYLPARLSPSGRAALVAVNEQSPRRVCVFALPGLEQTHELRLPPEAKDALADLADVAIDPVSGLLVLLSQLSRRLAVLRFDGSALTLLSTVDLPLAGRGRPEGLAYLSRGRLAVVTEDPAWLLQLRVTRRAARGVS